MVLEDKFGEDYFERGVEKGISGYTNYHYMPERVYPLANRIKDEGKILEWGCAKGFLTKALRSLGANAYGFDISKYAINNAEPEIRKYVTYDFENVMKKKPYDLVVAKDVLEHVEEENLDLILSSIHSVMSENGKLLVVVPLGENNVYRIREYEIDKTHKIRGNEEYWNKLLRFNYFKIEDFRYKDEGIKDNWTEKHPTGNGIWWLRKV